MLQSIFGSVGELVKDCAASDMLSRLPIVIALLSVYLSAVAAYRVFFSPLSKVPGPFLASLTEGYMAYYDLLYSGYFFKKVQDLHRQYGPIVRVSPHEVHISDPEFIKVLFTGNLQKRDKGKWLGLMLGLPGTTAAAASHELHRQRRAAMQRFFSKSSLRRLEPAIQRSLKNLLQRLQACGRQNDIVSMNILCKAATCDIITEYAFGRSTEYLRREDLNVAFFKSLDANFQTSWYMAYFPWVGPMLQGLPPSIMGIIYPGLKSLWLMYQEWMKRIEEIRQEITLHRDPDASVFHGILTSNLPEEEKSTERLRQEAQVLVQAGQDTTANSVAFITYVLLQNPDICHKLKAELADALPEPDQVPSAAVVENLPYLKAIIQETLRLYPSAVVRQSRVAPDTDLVYANQKTGEKWVIPAGVPMMMTPMPVHLNPEYFPEPTAFNPDRWLESPHLDQYLLTFSKGTRACIGIDLAYTEMFMLVAGIFRKYDRYDGTDKQTGPTMELYDTVAQRDVEPSRDFIISFPKRESKGVRVKVRH